MVLALARIWSNGNTLPLLSMSIGRTLKNNLAWPNTVEGEGNGTPLQYFCLEYPMDGGAWWAAVHGVTESDMTEQLHFHFSLSCIEEGNGNPLQCSCLKNPRNGGAWWAAICGVKQSQTWLKQLSSSSNTVEDPLTLWPNNCAPGYHALEKVMPKCYRRHSQASL